MITALVVFLVMVALLPITLEIAVVVLVMCCDLAISFICVIFSFVMILVEFGVFLAWHAGIRPRESLGPWDGES